MHLCNCFLLPSSHLLRCCITLLVIYSFLLASECGYVDHVTGDIQIKSISQKIMPGPLLAGRQIHNGDIIYTGEDGEITFTFDGENIQVSLDSQSKITVYKNNKNGYILLHHGKVFIENNGSGGETHIQTKNNFISQKKGELLINRNYFDDDQIFVINHQAIIKNTNGAVESISIGQVCASGENGISGVQEINELMITEKLFQKLEINRLNAKRGSPFTLFTTFTKDPEYIDIDTTSKIKRFKIPFETGIVFIEGNQYTQFSILPMYSGKYFKLGYDLEGFLGLADSATDLNNFSVLSKILSPLTLSFKSKWEEFSFKLGKIHNITYGFGTLISGYTNTVSPPIKQDAGIEINIKSGARNYTLDMFLSSITQTDNGIIGLYAKGRFLKRIPLTIGIGFVSDLNQFAALPDTSWVGVLPKKSGVSGFQLDFTYPLKNSFRSEMSLFLGLTALNFTNKLRFIRYEKVLNTFVDQGYQRKSAFSILGPGLWLKLDHHRDIKIAFNYASSLFASPFFSATYELERLHYVPRSELDSILIVEPYSEDTLWLNMITENLTNIDSASFYLPKQIHALLDPTRNVHNKFGLSAVYNYQYRKYYSYGLTMNIFKEVGSASAMNTFYTAGMNININEGVIRGINNFRIYFNQYFTKDIFSMTEYQENMILGFQLGIKITKTILLHIHRYDVFYDHDTNGKTDINSTNGVKIIAKF